MVAVIASVAPTVTITSVADDTADSLAITVNGKTAATTGSEYTYGIYATGGIDISNIAVNITVATSDAYAFAIAGNGASKFTNVTGSIDGGNRAIQVGNYAFTFTGCDLTLTGGEKAIQAKNENSQVNINSGTIRALLNPNYGGPQVGENDGFGVKATKLTVSSGATLIADGIRISSEEANSVAATATLIGNVTINDYSYAFSSNVTGYKPGFTVDQKATVTVGDGDKAAKLTINSEATFNGNVTVNPNATAEINEDVTVTGDITNNGKTEVYGTVKGNITGTGTIVADPAAVITGTVVGIIVPDADMEKPFYIGGILEVSQSIGNATLNDNLVIPEGLTLTVSGDLFLGSYSITVNGNLVIERNACVYGLGGSLLRIGRLFG